MSALPVGICRRGDLANVESPHKGADLLRKLMHVALNAGQVRRYLSLRRAWVRSRVVSNSR